VSEKKICPLTYSITKGAYDQENADFDYCTEEQCAWWDEDKKKCAILSLGYYLSLLWEHKYHTDR